MADRHPRELAVGDWLRIPNDDRVRQSLRSLVAQVIPGPSSDPSWSRRPGEVWVQVYEHGCLHEYWIQANFRGTVETLTPEEGESTWLIAKLTT